MRGPDGTSQAIVRKGGALPAAGKVVVATTRVGQELVELELVEEDEGAPARLVARARFTLPRGLPGNTWIPIELQVGADLRVRAEAREQLRRLRVPAVFDAGAREALHFTT